MDLAAYTKTMKIYLPSKVLALRFVNRQVCKVSSLNKYN